MIKISRSDKVESLLSATILPSLPVSGFLWRKLRMFNIFITMLMTCWEPTLLIPGCLLIPLELNDKGSLSLIMGVVSNLLSHALIMPKSTKF